MLGIMEGFHKNKSISFNFLQLKKKKKKLATKTIIVSNAADVTCKAPK